MSKPVEFQGHPYSLSKNPPTYRGVCKRVLDGDTFSVFIDMGLREYAYDEIRLLDFDTAEIFHPRNDAELQHGLQAKAYVQQLIENKPVLLKTHADSVTYGRYVAEVEFWDGALWHDLATELGAKGLAKKLIY